MSTRTENIADALMDLLAHARGCRHDDHAEEDRKKCMAVAEQIIEAVETKAEAKVEDHVDSWHRRDE